MGSRGLVGRMAGRGRLGGTAEQGARGPVVTDAGSRAVSKRFHSFCDISAKNDTQVSNKHMKRCSMSLHIREAQIKFTVKYHSTPARMVMIHKMDNNNVECGEIRTSYVAGKDGK